MSQPRQHPALEEFFRWEIQSKVEVVADIATDEKAYFIPLENVKSYFKADDSRKLSRIIAAVFDSDFPPVDPELILREHTAIFCILLSIGQGTLIEEFASYEELSDRRLPFDPDHPPRELTEASDDPEFLQLFCEKQRMYCVPIFDGHMLHKRFGRQRLLPITYAEPRGSEGLAEKYVIKLYGPHNKLFPAGTEMENPQANTFVLKRYPTKEAEAQYKQEVNGFRGVKHAESIIKFYGSFISGDESNILLEFADKGSLEEYFARESPPSRGADIIKFWESLFQLIKGLKAIHSVRKGHHDVKPESIMVLSSGSESQSNWQFKFAYFGLNKARAVPQGDAKTIGTQDASAYTPPEYSEHSDGQSQGSSKSWAVDIWSLGCIYSEAAVWIADGYKGLLDYRKQRLVEAERILFKGGACFHDGERALQSVLDAHRDIEDRLRRSDYITKDVLDSMVDEMMWEEDRPNAKALWRKAEMVSSRARQKLSSNSPDEFARPGSRSGHYLSLPRLAPPPTAPLPPIPKQLQPGLSSIAERPHPPNVEQWRSQIGSVSKPNFNRPGSEMNTPITPSQHAPSVATASDLDREISGSIASWQMNDSASQVTPITPFTSPHASFYYPNPNEGRPRLQSQSSYEGRPRFQSQSSNEYKMPGRELSRGQSFRSHSEWSEAPPPPLSEHPMYRQDSMVMSRVSDQSRTTRVDEGVDEVRSSGRPASVAGSRNSSAFSARDIIPEKLQIPMKSDKRAGFSLFPTKARKASLAKSDSTRSDSRSNFNDDDTVQRSLYSNDMPDLPEGMQSHEYLSLNTCMEWKKANKKVGKKSKVPPLPGAWMLQSLNDRDHIFIIDDSSNMAPHWNDVKRVFETLSYVVKGMSPEGTELFFTASYDTWRRKDTHDLVEYLSKKGTAGETNISYRLNLLLQAYRIRMQVAKTKKGKAALVRPMSIYILTNGEWGYGPDPKITIKEMADYLVNQNLKRQVAIQFISFAKEAKAMQKLNEVASTEFGVDIVDCTRWTGNVLRMLKGAFDKGVFRGAEENERDVGDGGVGRRADIGIESPYTSSSQVNVNELG